ncbi:MAG: UDP-N-acetylmuramoyl-L-alanine--D-glutamate ligase [Alphaproteobacteria bacterium]|nr:UDP-N-acetylmuramoyl-L-alanine--D-glutamate ligase [Alphaproteobacteria bacterium]
MKQTHTVIWGIGREGIEAGRWLHARAFYDFCFVDEREGGALPEDLKAYSLFTGTKAVSEALSSAQRLIKSPGVSLYHPLLEKERVRGLEVTSLLNLWLAEHPDLMTIGITGTKGKSTTASLLAHCLNALRTKTALLGNIGTPVSQFDDAAGLEACVIEVSSYQAADLSGSLKIGLVVSLYPEHLNWHGSQEVYYSDKLNLLKHSALKLCAKQVFDEAALEDVIVYDNEKHFRIKDSCVYDGKNKLGVLENEYLLRAHNHAHVASVLAVIQALKLDLRETLNSMKNFRSLPHRQQVLGMKEGRLYVDDSIATTPQAAIAAMEVYKDRPITLLCGGQDRGIDYTPLQEYGAAHDNVQLICLGDLAEKLVALIPSAHKAESMDQAVTLAQTITPQGGVILLSPAAPSYDMFENFEKRGEAFAKVAGV